MIPSHYPVIRSLLLHILIDLEVILHVYLIKLTFFEGAACAHVEL